MQRVLWDTGSRALPSPCRRHPALNPNPKPQTRRTCSQGASTTFQPLSGLLRGNCPPAAASVLVAAARLHDKLTVALYCRPTARLLFSAYILLLHILVML